MPKKVREGLSKTITSEKLRDILEHLKDRDHLLDQPQDLAEPYSINPALPKRRDYLPIIAL